MGVLAAFDDPFVWGSSGISNEVPGTYDVAINGHGYMINTVFEFGRRDSFRHSSIPAQTAATDISNQPGEATINPQGLWRSEFNDWSMGSGQLFVDRKESFPNRYHHSQGVDVFTNKWYASNLPDTQQLVEDTDTSCQVMVVSGYVYKLNSTSLEYSTDGSSYSPVSGLSGVTPEQMCTDGNSLYIACGPNGVFTTTAGSPSATQLVNVPGQAVNFVAYCSNVLIVASGASLYQINGVTTTWPTALITQNQSSWRWNSACGGNGWIYLGGFSSSSVSAVYKTQFASDGTTLSAPTVATPLPPGENVYSLFAFVNYILIGTSLGMRFCQTLGVIDPAGQDTGLLKIGPIIPNLQELVTKPVKCFTANQRFVYFGWSNYSQSTVKASNIPVTVATAAEVQANVAPTLPLTITMGVNDQFVFTPHSTGIPDTFTIAPGTYTDHTQVLVAFDDAVDSSSATFSSVADPYYSFVLHVAAFNTGAAYNGDTISEGNGGAAAVGFTTTAVFTGGADPTGGSQWTGLGWLDISTFTGDQTPAYSSHLMVSGTGEITSMDWWNGAPIFTVQGQGVFTASPSYVQGTIYSGYIGFRIPDQKVLVAYSVDTTSTAGSVSASINQDDENTYVLQGPTGTLFTVPQVFGELFETQLSLNTTVTGGPTTVRRATLQAYPAITAGTNYIVALTFSWEVETRAGRRAMDPYSEEAFLQNLRENQNLIIYQEGPAQFQVVVDDIDYVMYQPSQDPRGGFDGVMMVTLKTATSGLLT